MTPFVRSTHFLERDAFGRYWISLILFLLLITAWLVWFFVAPITLHETSRSANIDSLQTITATFAPIALDRVQVGQSAEMRLDDFPWSDYGAIEANVTASEFVDGIVTVTLEIDGNNQSNAPILNELSGKVLIVVDSVTPATLLARTIASRSSR